MKHKLLLLVTALVFSFNAFAISLHDAKSQGLVGEQTDGYLGVVVNSSEAQALAKSVNSKRRAHYEKIAKKNGISVDDVAKLAAQKAIEATAQGEYIQTPQGKWIKK
ncbi:YdbL family protein [Shewanella sp. Isolate11]|uniref:YdbL family protein n=1 Tax=Shewanella sp. Isolate11 TaxID=2908530 RepID=UPI001EFE36F0|nr:YdbL family protein [Shewanella sp. Isolate11]MCG9696818.1 YdbL family protein [Shewanella sp. Isolate11]